MAKKPAGKNPVIEESQPVSAKDLGAEITSYEVRKSDALAPVENFDPRKNLRSLANGAWRYICSDVDSIKDEVFESDLARQFGIRTNDIVYLVANKKHRIVVV